MSTLGGRELCHSLYSRKVGEEMKFRVQSSLCNKVCDGYGDAKALAKDLRKLTGHRARIKKMKETK